MIKANNLTMEYRQVLFKNLSFTLGNKEKVGLIGINGTGKTTLLKIIAGIESPDIGSLEIVNEKIEYLPQEYDFEKGTLVGELLEDMVSDPANEIYKVNRMLSKMELTDIDWYRDASTLSPGEKMKLYLTRLMLNEPTILLLDEPTNHLDIYGILWLEKFIKSFDGICIIVSHDRAFLNGVINKVFEIDEQKLNIYDGNYDDHLAQKELNLEKRHTMVVLQERKRDQFEKMIKRIKVMGGGEKQARALKAARSRMEREVTSKEVSKYKEQRISDIELKGQTHRTKQILSMKNLSFGYSKDKILLEDLNFQMYGKEKVWFYGANGIGKSTLIKLVLGMLKPISGEIKIGENVKMTYFSQDQSHMNMDKTLEDFFLENTNVSYSQSFKTLENFLFTKDMRRILIKNLSPGQRARLSFAVFAQAENDFLILDEPTNHIDIRSKEIIENALRNYKGAILLISHDRYFVESVGMDRSITLDNKKIVLN